MTSVGGGIFGVVGGGTFGVVAGAAPLDYADTVLADSPVGYWKLDETSGTTAVDSSGNGHNGTYTGPTLNTRFLSSALGTVASFDGTNDRVTTAVLPASTGARSVEVWVIADTLSSQRAALCERFSGSGNPVEARLGVGPLFVGSSTNFYLNRYPGSGSWVDVGSPNSTSTATLYHVVGTLDGTTMRLYVNGVEVATLASGIAASSGEWYIGAAHTGGSPYWAGAIGHVAIYDTVLSPTRIAAHYAAGA